MTPNINLEPRYDHRKGIYVLTYTGKPPYKIGMTNAAIAKRINSYVNCPSQQDGHYIHFLLTWDIKNSLNAYTVEQFIFRKLAEGRMNSTQRKMAFKTEHFDVSLDVIRKVLLEAKEHYQKEKEVRIELHEPKGNAVYTMVKGKKNVRTTKYKTREKKK